MNKIFITFKLCVTIGRSAKLIIVNILNVSIFVSIRIQRKVSTEHDFKTQKVLYIYKKTGKDLKFCSINRPYLEKLNSS